MSTGDIEVQAKDIKILNKSAENLSFYPFSKAGGNVSKNLNIYVHAHALYMYMYIHYRCMCIVIVLLILDD